MAIKVIIGLRNPGSTYEKTRHNAGAWFVEALAASVQSGFKVEKKIHAEVADYILEGHSCKLLLPLTFMNNSGLAAQAAVKYYNVSAEEILIAYDDLDLSAGSVRFKKSKGHGGHNGLRDILQCLANCEFERLRFGIGHPGHRDFVLNYVLGKPSLEDKKLITEAINKAMQVIPEILAGDSQRAMNFLHAELSKK